MQLGAGKFLIGFGTHHARDAWHLFNTRRLDLDLFSSIKLNTRAHAQYLVQPPREAGGHLDAVMEAHSDPYVALTEKMMASPIFSFGRDHGYFGRILNQTVMSVPTLTVRGGHEIIGFCFTPQDGNSLLSSITATAWLLYPDTYEERLHQVVHSYLFDEV